MTERVGPFATLDVVIEILETGDHRLRHAMLHLVDKARKEWAADRAHIAAAEGRQEAAPSRAERGEVR